MKNSIIILNLFLFILLVGCSKDAIEKFPKDSNVTINIGYINEEQFKQRYKELLESEYPNVRFNVVSTKVLNDPKMMPLQYLQENDVDVLFIPAHRIQEFIDEGLLTDIGPLIERDQINLKNYVSSVIELIRQYGQGKLYGMPTTFYGQAIAFNSDVFDEYKIEYPRDQMSWLEILQLANKFSVAESNHKELKGITLRYSNLVNLILHIGNTEGLQVYNAKRQQVMINGSAWSSIWRNTIEIDKLGSLDFNVDLNTYIDPFLSGDRAMAIISYDDFKRLEQHSPSFKWSTVTMPVSPSEPSYTHYLKVPGIYAIPNSTGNKEAAWDIIKFLNSDQAARWEYRTDYGFSTLSNHLVTNEKYKELVMPFYQLSPVTDSFDELPFEILELLNPYAEDIINERISLQEGLDRMQEEAENTLKDVHP